ncbi:unnamed protein product [Sphagnum tenellum]
MSRAAPSDAEMADLQDQEDQQNRPRPGLQQQVEYLINQRAADRVDIIESRNRLNNMTADLANVQNELREAQRDLQEILNGPQAFAAAMAGLLRGGAPGGIDLGAVAGVLPGAAPGGAPAPGGAFPAGPAPAAPGGAAGGAAAPFHRVKTLPRFCFEGKVDEDWLSFRDMFRNYARFRWLHRGRGQERPQPVHEGYSPKGCQRHQPARPGPLLRQHGPAVRGQVPPCLRQRPGQDSVRGGPPRAQGAYPHLPRQAADPPLEGASRLDRRRHRVRSASSSRGSTPRR